MHVLAFLFNIRDIYISEILAIKPNVKKASQQKVPKTFIRYFWQDSESN
jgi:hypothetical protein